MIRLATPHALWLAVGIMLAGWLWATRRYRWRRRWQQTAVWPWLAPFVAQNGRFPQWRLLVALLLCTIALARPQWGQTSQPVHSTGLQIMVLLDLSNSMQVADVAPTRLAVAKQQIAVLATALQPEDALGIVGFAGDTRLLLPLTPAFDTLLPQVLETADPANWPTQGSLLAPAIETAVDAFPTATTGQPWLIIFTDGEVHDPLRQVTHPALHADTLQLTIVGVGTESGGPIPRFDPDGVPDGYFVGENGRWHHSRLEAAPLAELADRFNGRYLPADAFAEQLPQLIAQYRLQQSEPELAMRPIDRYPLFVLAALLLLIGQYLPSGYRWPTAGGRRLVRLLPLILLIGCQSATPGRLLEAGNEAYAQTAYEAAGEWYARGLGTTETAVFAYNLANTQYRLGDYATAIQHARRAETSPTLQAQALFTQGNSHFQQGSYEAAVAAYQAVLRLTPSDMDAKHNLELALLRLAAPEEDGAEQATTPQERPLTPLPNGDQRFNPSGNTGATAAPVSATDQPSALPQAIREAAEQAPLLTLTPAPEQPSPPVLPEW